MLVSTVSELLEMSVDAVPEAFKGKVTKVFNHSPNDKGSMQKLAISDGQKEIEILFADRPAVPRTFEGSQIYAVASRGQRGLSGLKRKQNIWKNKTTEQVWVYDSADVSFEGSNGQQQQSAPPPQQQRQAPPANTNGNGHANGNGNGYANTGATPIDADAKTREEIKIFNNRLGRTSAAYMRSFDAAINLIKTVNGKHDNILGKPSAELIEKIAVGMLVNACWTQKPADLEFFPKRAFDEYAATTNGHANGNTHSAPPENAPPPNRRQGPPFN